MRAWQRTSRKRSEAGTTSATALLPCSAVMKIYAKALTKNAVTWRHCDLPSLALSMRRRS